MATTFCLSIDYNFSCMIASDTLFDSRGWFSGSSYHAFVTSRIDYCNAVLAYAPKATTNKLQRV